MERILGIAQVHGAKVIGCFAEIAGTLGMCLGRRRENRRENFARSLDLQGAEELAELLDKKILVWAFVDESVFESGKSELAEFVALVLDLRVKRKQAQGGFPAGNEFRLFVDGFAVDGGVKA